MLWRVQHYSLPAAHKPEDFGADGGNVLKQSKFIDPQTCSFV